MHGHPFLLLHHFSNIINTHRTKHTCITKTAVKLSINLYGELRRKDILITYSRTHHQIHIPGLYSAPFLRSICS
uniref:Uncharacterized protein n=1 Tax=Anguilla anguilla TaxID=7936 RepID=A0A0E9S0N1_ANGAN